VYGREREREREKIQIQKVTSSIETEEHIVARGSGWEEGNDGLSIIQLRLGIVV